MKLERVYVACDVANLWKSCKFVCGDRSKIDFQILKDVLPALFPDEDLNFLLNAYIITHPNAKHKNFQEVLENLNYSVMEKFITFNKVEPDSWSAGITLDALRYWDKYDTFLLISCDSAYAPLMDYMMNKKKTVVLNFERTIPDALLTRADKVFYLSREIVYR